MEKNKLFLEDKNNRILAAVLILSIIIGFVIRIIGLGKWPLAIDEYYIVKSIEYILNFGLPRFPNGGYYERGILYQYLTAGLLLIGLKTEFAARLIPVLTNIATVIPLYLLSKKIGGKFIAVFVVFAFCFSIWEVEFARFARMYSPFQLIFAAYVYFLYKNLFEGDAKALIWILILSFISIFIYEASIFLAVTNFLPLIWSRSKKTFDISVLWKDKKNYIFIAAAIVVLYAAYLFLTLNFRFLWNHDTLPPDVTADMLAHEGGGRLRMPFLFLSEFNLNKTWGFLFIIPLSLAVYTCYKFFKDSLINPGVKISFTLLILLSLMNLFGLMIISLFIFLLVDWIKTNEIKKYYKLPLFTILLSFIFYSAFAVFTKSWHQYFPKAAIIGPADALKTAWKEFINYPYIYETFVLFRDTIPFAAVITVILLGAGLFLIIKKDLKAYKFFYFLLILLIMMVDILNLPYFKTRYFFFIYPLIIFLGISAVSIFIDEIIRNQILRAVSFIIIFGIILILSEDYDLVHLTKIDNKEFNFREGMTFKLKDHYYPRWDVRTPDEIVNKNLKKDDIVVTDQQISEYYLKRLDYIYKDYRSNDFVGESVLNGTKERWTDSKLIYRNTDLINLLTNNPKRKWVVRNTMYGKDFFREVSFHDRFAQFNFYTNPDSTVIVYKIPANIK